MCSHCDHRSLIGVASLWRGLRAEVILKFFRNSRQFCKLQTKGGEDQSLTKVQRFFVFHSNNLDSVASTLSYEPWLLKVYIQKKGPLTMLLPSFFLKVCRVSPQCNGMSHERSAQRAQRAVMHFGTAEKYPGWKWMCAHILCFVGEVSCMDTCLVSVIVFTCILNYF